MRILDDIKLDYKDVLICPKRSTLESRKEVDLYRTFDFYWGKSWTGVPIVSANMDTTGTVDMGKALSRHNMLTCLSKHVKHCDADVLERESMALSFGMNKEDMDSLFGASDNYQCLSLNEYAANHKFFCLDVANGYTQKFVNFVKEVRQKWPDKIIIAGNVVTREMTEALILAGADIIKVGIGPGSVCTTRKIAGVGYPQLSAVAECADAAHGLGGHIMADGGCQSAGDVAKAFAAGADFVMIGGLFAGHDETLGDIIDVNGVAHKRFYGMSSDTAMDLYSGGVATYRASEGKTVTVPYRGSIDDTVQEILGGIRSACTYVGARSIKQLPKCATFVRVNRQLKEMYS